MESVDKGSKVVTGGPPLCVLSAQGQCHKMPLVTRRTYTDKFQKQRNHNQRVNMVNSLISFQKQRNHDRRTNMVNLLISFQKQRNHDRRTNVVNLLISFQKQRYPSVQI